MSEHQQVLVESQQELRDWLKAHHQQKESLWLVKWKKGHSKNYLSYDDIVDELICFGWVDSLPRKLDAQKTMLRISPRKPQSNWSSVNKERVKRLIEAGKMEAAGLAMVEIAKQNGRWDFLNDVEKLILPEDLKLALGQNAEAERYFQNFPPASKRGILEWIKNAKQADTRKKRIEETVRKASLNRKANHPKGRDAGPNLNEKRLD